MFEYIYHLFHIILFDLRVWPKKKPLPIRSGFRKVHQPTPCYPQLLCWKWHFLAKNITQNRKTLSQNIWYFNKIKSFWKLMIWFCYYWKKCFLFWAWPMGTPFLYKLGQKIVIFGGFSNFFENYRVTIKAININSIP